MFGNDIAACQELVEEDSATVQHDPFDLFDVLILKVRRSECNETNEQFAG